MTKPFNAANATCYPALIGCDEVGRGALCGPVVVAAVWFDPVEMPSALFNNLDDSKKISAKTRFLLAQEIRRVAKVVVAANSATRIDRYGIRVMTLEAMQRAAHRLDINALVCVDGRDVPPGIELPCEAVIKGDAKIPQIAAASIIAKVFRDSLMVRLAARYPGYGWEKNMGYGTAAHLAALTELGPTPHHRRTFNPVSQL